MESDEEGDDDDGNIDDQRATLQAAESLHKTGCLFVKDSRVKEEDNNAFLDLLERYFASSDGIRDARPDLSYQVKLSSTYLHSL